MNDKLRSVIINHRWKLETFDSFDRVDYEFTDMTRPKAVLFHGAINPKGVAIDSDETLRSVLDFVQGM